MIRVVLDDRLIKKLLYYETGFEQLHPVPEVHAWMESHGWEYYKDWNCTKLDHYEYGLEFRDKEMMTMFLLRWT